MGGPMPMRIPAGKKDKIKKKAWFDAGGLRVSFLTESETVRRHEIDYRYFFLQRGRSLRNDDRSREAISSIIPCLICTRLDSRGGATPGGRGGTYGADGKGEKKGG